MTEQGKLETDEVEASRAPLLDHLNELRSRLIKSVIGVVAGMIVCAPFLSYIVEALLWPFSQALIRYNARMVAAGKPTINMEIIATQPLETFFVKLKIGASGPALVVSKRRIGRYWHLICCFENNLGVVSGLFSAFMIFGCDASYRL